jgi:succinyl-diaminopimelate desuccinylase
MDVLALAQQLIRIATVNPPGDERRCAQIVARLLEDGGFAVATYEFAPRRTSLVARLGGASDAPLCFTGHLDVVPLGGLPWAHDPFAAETAAGRLYGRGSTDMKSGIAAFVVAALRVAPYLRRGPGLSLVITAGEETLSEGARHLISVPGALGDAGAVVVAEPTGNYPHVGHKGVFWLDARLTGVTAHASTPERGVNAIHRMAEAVRRLQHLSFDVPPHPLLGSPTLNVGTCRGGHGKNSVPDAAELGIDVRTIPGQEPARVLADLAAALGPDVTLESAGGVASVWTDPDDPWVQSVFDACAPLIGERPVARAVPYATDASLLTPAYGGVPTVVVGPGELALAHQTDEYCRIERLEQAVELYGEIARRWCRI